MKWRLKMFNKYNLKRAKLHFKKLSIIEKLSIFAEKMFLKIKDTFRFVKLDRSILSIAIKEMIYIVIIITAINMVGNLILFNNGFRDIKCISEILNSLTFIYDNYNQYLLACLGVGGFLVALFLSNLSGIITAKYINIVSKVSLSVLNEYANKKYLKSMINYLCLIIVQLACWIFNIRINPVIALLSLFLTVRIIIIYFELAQRVYLFSDINMLTKTIYQEINIRFKYLQKAIKNNKSDSVFNSYGNQVILLLDTLKSLQKEILKDKDTEDITKFTNYIFAIMVRYTEFKNLIPLDSKWYRLKYEPVNWFEAEFFEVNLRTQTGTSLNNKQIADHYFLEEYITDLFTKSIKFLIKNNRNEELYRIINNYYLSLDMILANCGDFEYWNKFNKNIEDIIINSNLAEDDNYEAIIDFISLNKVSFVLNAQKYISNTYNSYIKKSINELGTFLTKDSKNNILFVNVGTVKFIEKIKYELSVEGKVITSDKYIHESLSFNFIKMISLILKTLELNYDNICLQAENLSKKSYSLSSCLLYSRIIEIENKLIMVIDEISSIYEELIKEEYNFKFDKLNVEELLDKINKKHYSNLIEYAKTFLSSDKCDYKSVKIDFCGEIFYNFSEAILETVLNNDYDNFEIIYQYYPSICFMAEAFIYNNLDRTYNQNYLISKYKIPMITFMNLNGCIIYHSHIINDDRWEIKVKNTFNSIVKKLDNSYEILKKMALYASVDNHSFDMNEMILNIKQRYSRYLHQNDLIKIKECSDSIYYHKEIDTNDPLIKEFTHIAFEDYIDFYFKFYEIFIIYYVNPLLKDEDKYDCRLEIKKVGAKNGK
jgi:hypothetical protein